MTMRKEVINELKTRITALEEIAKPNDISTGMTGSFIKFNHYIQSHTAMTQREFDDGVYNDWLRKEHSRIFHLTNKKFLY